MIVSSKAFTASRITYHKSFSNSLGISRYKVSSWRGAPPSEHVQSPFALMSELEATQRGGGKEGRSYASMWHDLEHFLVFFSLSILVLQQ